MASWISCKKGVQLGTHPKRTKVSPKRLDAWATCDRSGFVTNHGRMVKQYDWRGTHLVDLGILVSEDMVDKPQRQLATLVLPPDPGSVLNARIEPYTMEETAAQVPPSVLVHPDGTVVVGSRTFVAGGTQGFVSFPKRKPEPLTLLFFNLKTDFGAVGDGVTDDSAAFIAFMTVAQPLQDTLVTLTIPPGSYLNTATVPQNTHGFFAGIKNLIIDATGATVQNLAGGGIFPNTILLIAEAFRGDSIVTLLTPSQASALTVGGWICIGSLEMQTGTYPPNLFYNEYHQITGIKGGVVSLDAPLSYHHLTTYPHLIDGQDEGGPAAIFVLLPNFDQTVVFNGGSYGKTGRGAQLNLAARDVTFNNVTFLEEMDPGQGRTVTFNGCTFNAGTEIDKCMEALTFNNCSCIGHNMLTQSASNAKVVVNGCNFSNFANLSRDFVCTNSSIATMLFRTGYGSNQFSTISDSAIGAYMFDGALIDLTNPNVTYANGTFQCPRSDTVASNSFYQVAIPGQNGFFIAFNQVSGGNPFQVLAVHQDATNVYMDTDLPLASLPAYFDQFGSPVTLHSVMLQPSPNVTIRTCTGDPAIVDLSGAPQRTPIFSYSKRTYSGNLAAQSLPLVPIIGYIVSITVNVTKAYTGSSQPTLGLTIGPTFWDASNHLVIYQMVIDLKTVGQRTVTPTSVTVVSSADSIAAPGVGWISGTYGISVANIGADDPSTWPSLTVTVQTDQRIKPPFQTYPFAL